MVVLAATRAGRSLALDEQDSNTSRRFKAAVMPHLDAAYNLARWLTRDAHDAEDAVQESFLRAYRGFGSFRGDDARCWLLTVVRNTCYTLIERNRNRSRLLALDADPQQVASD